MNYLLTFLEGFASFISPCMLPMVPIYISYFAGKDEKQNGQSIINSIGFVLGFTISFVAMALLTSFLGTLLASYIKYIKIIFGVLIIILGLNYMKILKIKFLSKSYSHESKTQNINFFRAILFGLLFSISYTPCVGAFLASALLMITGKQDLIKGLLLILSYSLGLGIPFIISALIIDKLKSTFNFIKKHYAVIEKISGILLIIMGFYVIFF